MYMVGTRFARKHDPLTLARTMLGVDPFYRVRAERNKPAFNPSFEVVENESGYVLNADLPGVKESDIDISLHNNVLTISGARASEERVEGEKYLVYERQYGSFSRSFTLPDNADANAVDAHLKDGVLSLSIGKQAEAKPRKISVTQ